MGSLGFQWTWERFNVPHVVSCERFFRVTPESAGGGSGRGDSGGSRGRFAARGGRFQRKDGRSGAPAHGGPVSFESGRPLGGCDLLLASISYELDFPHLVRMLAAGGAEPLRSRRSPDEPALVIGGPLTRANPLPLAAIADVVVVGDGEPAVAALVAHIQGGGMTDAHSVVDALRGVPGAWIPSESPVPPPSFEAEAGVLPVVSAVATPHSAFPDLHLVEISRGCPKSCTFCLGRRPDPVGLPESGSTLPIDPGGPTPADASATIVRRPSSIRSPFLRFAPTESILSALPSDGKGAGIIGAALSYHPGLAVILESLASRGLKAGLSSLRADRMTSELAALLKATGGEVLTVAADGISERVRSELRKDVTEADLVKSAELARDAGIHALKIYAMVGLPGETEDDVLEFAGLLNRLNTQLPVIASLSVFVPKKGTPLEHAPFGPVDRVSDRLQMLRRHCSGGIRINRVSAREAMLQWLYDHASVEDGERMVLSALAGQDDLRVFRGQ